MNKRSNSEVLKAMGYEEPKCNVADLYDTPDNHESKAKVLPIQRVSNNEVAVSCRTCKWVNADYDDKCYDCGELANWEQDNDC